VGDVMRYAPSYLFFSGVRAKAHPHPAINFAGTQFFFIIILQGLLQFWLQLNRSD
jgi:hypothetical protein